MMNVMKSIVALVAFSCFSPVGQAAVKWAGYAPSRYTIMCSSQAEPEESKEIAFGGMPVGYIARFF